MAELEKLLQKMYLERYNNYLTNRKFAMDYNIPFEEVDELLRVGREVHERLVRKYKQEKVS